MPRRRREPAPLPPEHVRFIEEYLIDDNGTRAYKAAYPAATYQTCKVEASRLLAKPNIKREIRAARDARQRRTQIRADTALREAGRLAFSDPLYLFEDDGVTPRNIRDIPADTRRAIASVKVRREKVETHTTSNRQTTKRVVVTHDIIEFKLWPKPKGLDKVFRHLGLEQEITPLDALLAALPADLAGQVRQAIAGLVPGGTSPAGPDGRPA